MDLPTDEIVKTKDIKKTLANYASKHSISVSRCYFIIEHISTYMKTISDDDFKLFNEDISQHYKDKNELINQHVEFRQVYTILIRTKKISNFNLKYSINLSNYVCHPKIILDPDSYIPYKRIKAQETFNLLVDEINIIKAENGILIEVFDDSMLRNLNTFVKHLYQGKFKKRVRIPLFDGVEPDIVSQGKLVLLFKEKNKKLEQKNQIIEVEKGETLAEFRKPKFGKNGFNAYGKQILQTYGTNTEDLQVPIDEITIYLEEDGTKKLYKSRLKGFVSLTSKLLSVQNKVKRSKLSRMDDSIAQDEDNNIEVQVFQYDTSQDSIGEGVKLKSEFIHVKGHVGANSKLEALNIKIDGATHSSSKQFAKTAIINRHKGTLRCNNAKIKLLEGGVVHATNLEIESSLGGTIYAQNVTIGHIKSNLKVYASHSITVRLVSGENNIFQIDYKNIPIINSKINFLEQDIDNIKFSLNEAKLNDIEKVSIFENNLKELQDEIKNIQESALTAKIRVEKPFLGLNTINFTLENNNELIYKTQNRAYSPFYLEIKEDKIILHPVNVSIPLTI